MSQSPPNESHSTSVKRPWLWWIVVLGTLLGGMMLIETLITHLPADYPM